MKINWPELFPMILFISKSISYEFHKNWSKLFKTK